MFVYTIYIHIICSTYIVLEQLRFHLEDDKISFSLFLPRPPPHMFKPLEPNLLNLVFQYKNFSFLFIFIKHVLIHWTWYSYVFICIFSESCLWTLHWVLPSSHALCLSVQRGEHFISWLHLRTHLEVNIAGLSQYWLPIPICSPSPGKTASYTEPHCQRPTLRAEPPS